MSCFGNFGCFGSFGSFGLGSALVGLFPSLAGLIQWHKKPTEDGLTLPDSSTGGLSLAEIVDVPCLSFDGVDDRILVYTTFIGDFYWSAWVRRDETGTKFSLLANFLGDGIRLNGKAFQWQNFYAASETISHTTDIEEDIFYFLEMERVGTDLTLTVDGVAETSTTISTTVDGTKYLGNSANSQTSAMSVSQVTYRGDTTPHIWDLEEGQGTTAYDSSGNGNDGTIDGATWTTADGIPSRNRKDGCSPMTISDGVNDALNLGVAPKESTVVTIRGGWLTTTGANRCIIGSRTTADVDDFLVYINAAGEYIFQFGDSPALALGVFAVAGVTTTLKADKTGLTIDGILYPITYTTMSTGTQPFSLFVFNGMGTNVSFADFECDYCIIEEDDGATPVREIFPNTINTMVDRLDGTVYTNTGAGLLGMKRIPALADGSGLDAKNGLPLTNPAIGPDNNSGTKTIQTDFRVLPSVLVTGDDNVELFYQGIVNDKPYYSEGPSDIYGLQGGGTFWVYSSPSVDGGIPVTAPNSTLPQIDDYDDGMGGAVSIAYDSFWIENGEFIARSQAEIEANNDDADAQRSAQKLPNLRDSLFYSEAPTGDELNLTNAYIDSREA